MRKLKKIALTTIATTLMCIIGITANAKTISPYGGCVTSISSITVQAWFDSGYKTKPEDTKYGVKSGKYVKQCWVRIQEGSYDEKRWSEAFTIKQKKQGSVKLQCFNNPFKVATATWGWKYN